MTEQRVVHGLACWQGEWTEMAEAHQHDDIEFNLSPTDLDYLVDGRRVVIPKNQLAVFWAARPHQLLTGSDGSRMSWLTVPLPVFLGWGLAGELVPLLLRGRVLAPQMQADATDVLLERWSRDLGSSNTFLVDTARLEVQAFCRRVSLAALPGSGGLPDHPHFLQVPSGDRATRTAGSMAEFITSHAAEDIGVDDVAACVHLHPRYAMTLFKRVIGTTIGSYIAQCRIGQAQRLLLTSTLTIPDISEAVGFRSMSQFYDRFSRTCGMAPATYRRLHQSEALLDERAPKG